MNNSLLNQSTLKIQIQIRNIGDGIFKEARNVNEHHLHTITKERRSNRQCDTNYHKN